MANTPICSICNTTNTIFPLTPKNNVYTFGDICVDCDDRIAERKLYDWEKEAS